jgi:hypothetical protein
VTLRGSPPRGFYRCPLCTFKRKNRLFFAKNRMFHHGPMPPDIPTSAKNARFVEKIEYSICHRPIAITHMKYHHRMLHACQSVAVAVPAPPKGDTATTQSTTRSTTALRIQVCPACSRALSAVSGLLYNVSAHQKDVISLRVMGGSGSPKYLPGSSQATPVHHVSRCVCVLNLKGRCAT